MKFASDYRRISRDSLRGKWTIAVIAGLIAALLGGIGSGGPEITLNVSDTGANISLKYGSQQLVAFGEGGLAELSPLIIGGISYLMIAAIVLCIVFFVLGSIIEIGYSRFNLDLIDQTDEPQISSLFSYFSHWKTILGAKLLKTLYIILWSLLFVIPGIIASYSYAMTGYILAENPELTPSEALDRSKNIMSGNRWRLFCLQFSFIGWSILSSFTFGIGNLWLTPYMQAATAAFYRDLSCHPSGYAEGEMY